MTHLKKIRYKTKTRNAGAFVLSRLLVALFVVTMFLVRLCRKKETESNTQF